MRTMVESSSLQVVEEAYRVGRFVDAWTALGAPGTGPRTGRAHTLEQRLLHHLGAPKRSLRAAVKAYRRDRLDEHARIGVAYAVFERRGALAARDWLAAHSYAGEDEPVLMGERIELDTHTLVALRDFAAARRMLDRWRERGIADVDRIATEVYLLASERRLPEALEAARKAVEANPRHRRLVTLLGSLLTSSDRPGEALALLRDTTATMQCAQLVQMRFAIALATEQHDACAEAVDALPALLPFAEPDVLVSLTLMRAESRYRRGDIAGARALTASGEDPAVKRFAARLAADEGANRRKRLDVPAVLQDHLGCVPATLSAISKFHGRAADHLELAERICYHGTAAHAERSWAETHGFVTREMRLTWRTAVLLIERDVPFVVTTFDPGNGHAQAVIGFDERRHTLILRDPSLPLPVEADADEFIEAYRHSGPRCLVLVPRERAEVLDGLELDDSELYDMLYEIEGALDAHDRKRAAAACARLMVRAPAHRVARAGRRALAAYDEDPLAVLAIAQEALAADPENLLAVADRLMTQGAGAPRSARLEALEQALLHANKAPMFLELLANELAGDAREHARVLRLSKRALRIRHDSARSVGLLGQIAWQRGDTQRGEELLRFAACLEPTNEAHVRQYSLAARKTGRSAEALAFVRAHFEKLASRNAAPGILLADALEDAGDIAGAHAALERASALRSDDGTLLLERSRRAAAEGRCADARALLERARGKSDDVSWSRGGAILAAAEGASEEEQLAAWQRVAESAPLAMDAHLNIATLIRRTQGHSASAAFLAARVERFPHHRPTILAHLESLRDVGPSVREGALRKFLETEPSDAWAHRELALLLAEQKRHDEARASLDQVAALGSHSVAFHLTRAVVAERRNDIPGARAAYLDALAVDADAALAVTRLLELAAPEERQALVSQLFELTERSAVVGSTFEALYVASAPHVASQWLVGALERARTVRPDVSTIWILSIRHALGAGPVDAAMRLVGSALERFALVPEVHLAAADAWSVAGDQERAIRHLERAVELGPQLPGAVARLANALEARGDKAAVDALLERSRRRAFFDSTIALEGIRVRARRGEHEQAIRETAALLEREPELRQAWDMLLFLSTLGPGARAAAVGAASLVAVKSPGSENAQSSHAVLLLDGGDIAPALELLDRALERNARSILLRDAKAAGLALAGRHDEALALCAPLPGERPSDDLGMRAAWVYANAGRMPEAVATLRAVLRDHPSLVSGWQRLVDWSLATSDTRSALDAATRLLALAPLASSSQATMAKVLLAHGDRLGAKVALARAIERDPGALHSAQQLFELARHDRDVAAAKIAHPVLERRVPDAARVAIDVEMALLTEAPREAKKRFGEACKDATVAAAELIEAYDALQRARLGKSADRRVEEAFAEPTSNPAVGTLWMRAGLARDIFFPFALRGLSPSSPHARAAALSAFEVLAQQRWKVETRKLVDNLRTWLRADDVTWAAPLTALVSQGSYFSALRWGRDWSLRKGAPRARLHVLGVAMHALGLRRRAFDLMRSVAAEASAADAAGFRAWMAFDDAASGRTAAAARELARVEGQSLPPVAMSCAFFADVLVAIQRA
jgi:predicted Zn-dependent protease